MIADALVFGIPGIGVGVDDGSLPPQATSNATAVERRSSRMNFSFTQPYYLKRLLNGSAEAAAYLFRFQLFIFLAVLGCFFVLTEVFICESPVVVGSGELRI